MAIRSRKNKNLKTLDRYKTKTEKKPKDAQEFWEKLARHKADILMRTGAVLIICALATGIFYLTWLNKEYTSYDVISEVSYPIFIGSNVLRFDNNVLIYSSDGIKCVNPRGEVVWNETFQMQNPMIEVCNNMVGVADYNGSVIHLMDSNGPIGTINTGIPIQKFKISSAGYVIAILNKSDIAPIYIYDTSGEKKVFFSTSMNDFGYPVEMAISDNGLLVGISYQYVDIPYYKTDIAFYNFGEVGQNETDNLVSAYNYSEAVVPTMHFLGNNRVVAVADNRLMFYSGDQKPVSMNEELIYDKIVSVFYGKENVALVFRNSDGEQKYRIDVYDSNGKKKDTIYFNDEYQDIFFDNGRVIVYSAEKCLIRKIGAGDKYSGEFDRAILGMLPTKSSEKFVLITSDGFQVIELK